MKEQCCIQSLLHREPCCHWRRWLWSFRACLPCHGSTSGYPGNVSHLTDWAAWRIEGMAAGQAVCRECTWTLFQQSSDTSLCTLWLRRRLPHHERRLCPSQGWCSAQHSRFSVGVASRACHCTSCENMMDLMGKKLLIVWFFTFFFLTAYQIARRNIVTCCVLEVSLETWGKWEGGITKSILFL